MSSKFKLPPLDPDLTPTSSPTTRTKLEQQEAYHACGGVKPQAAEDLRGRLENATASESGDTPGPERQRVESEAAPKPSQTVLPPIKGTFSSSKTFPPELTETGQIMAEEEKTPLETTESTSPPVAAASSEDAAGAVPPGVSDEEDEEVLSVLHDLKKESTETKEPWTDDPELLRKSAHFEDTAFVYITRENKARQLSIRIVCHPIFEQIVIVIILYNTILLGIADYGSIDTDPNSDTVGDLVTSGSPRNQVLNGSELPLAVLYTIEAALKIFAMGFFCYLEDAWNVMDFVVTLAGLIAVVGVGPNLSFLRTFRVLRPLRSLSQLKGMKVVVTGMLAAIPQLMSVIVLLAFIFFVFGIIAVQLFSGLLSSRCRLTPYPVNNSWVPGKNFEDYRCLDSTNFDTPDDHPNWVKEDSPWHDPQECFWPIDEDDERICTFGGGLHVCMNKGVWGSKWVNESDYRWCGSNYDALGNPRFKGGHIKLYNLSLTADQANQRGTHNEGLSWGLTNFDNIISAFITIFQIITLEGWTTIMYMTMDAFSGSTAIYFVFLVIFGSFFVLNLVLAVLEYTYTSTAEEHERKEKEEAQAIREELERQLAAAKLEGRASPSGEPIKRLSKRLSQAFSAQVTRRVNLSHLVRLKRWVQSPPTWPWRHKLREFTDRPEFEFTVLGLIIVNTVVLACDHHPMEDRMAYDLEIVNFVLTISFAIEMLLKLGAMGVWEYSQNSANLFDGLIVVLSFVELAVGPPEFISGRETEGGALTALRACRLFRIFKLAKKWKKMHELLGKMVETLFAIWNVAFLLLLFMYIFSLLGMQLFANRMKFDDENYHVTIGEYGWENIESPRANFDTLLWSFTTIFQILSGENWNTVLYDCWRATGAVAVVYFMLLLIIGMFIVLNLFLAILLSKFGDDDDEEEEVEWEEEEDNTLLDLVKNLGKNDWGKIAVELSVRTGKPSRSEDAVYARHKLLAKKQPRAHMTLMFVAKGASKFKNLLRKNKINPEVAADEENGNDQVMTHHEKKSVVRKLKERKLSVGMTSEATKIAITAHKRKQEGEDGGDEHKDDGAAAEDGGFEDEEDELTKMGKEEDVFPLDPGKSLFLFDENNPFRVQCGVICAHAYFEQATMIFIGISSLALAVDNPLYSEDSTIFKFLRVMDYIFTVYFIFEMVVKIVTKGFGFEIVAGIEFRRAYIKDPWNVLDFFIVVISVISLATAGSSGSGLRSLRSLRALRALRPLRMIQRAPNLKLVVNSIIIVVPDVINVLLVLLLCFIMFGILFVQYFKGRYFACQGDVFDEDIAGTKMESFLRDPVAWTHMDDDEKAWFGPNATLRDYSECTVWNGGAASCCGTWPSDTGEKPTSKTVCHCLGAEWARSIPQSFDNIGVAIVTLYEISTTEAWVDVMLSSVDATDIDMQPIRDNNEIWVWMFILFILLGSFFFVNLFIGVLYDRFMEMQDKLKGKSMFLTQEQQDNLDTLRLGLKFKPLRQPRAPDDDLGRVTYKMANHPLFDPFIVSCIVLNTIAMAIVHYGQDTQLGLALEYLNYIFAFVFTVEAVIKICAVRWLYFEDNWNNFDFSIVIGTAAGLAVKFASGTSGGGFINALRAFRLGRILRLIQGAKSLREVFNTLTITMYGLINIGLLLMLIMFIYTVMGVQLFAKVQFNGDLNEHANFRNFGVAFITLFRFSTGENWNGFMYNVAYAGLGSNGVLDDDDDCVVDPEYDKKLCGFNDFPGCEPLNGCGTNEIFPFLTSFTLAVTFVALNLFIGVVLDGFQKANESDHFINPQDFEKFQSLWMHYDPDATTYIDSTQFLHMMQNIDEPWGYGKSKLASKEELIDRIDRLNVPLYPSELEWHDGSTFTRPGVYYFDVFFALTNIVIEEEALRKDPNADISTLQIDMDDPSMAKLRKAVANKTPSILNYKADGIYKPHHDFAARLIIKTLTSWKVMKRLTGGSMDPKELMRARLSLLIGDWREMAAMGDTGLGAKAKKKKAGKK